MVRSNVLSKLTSVDELFTTQSERDETKRESVKDIPLSQIKDFPNHPFKVRSDGSMFELAESIRLYGVLVPALVRPLDDGTYEMVSGHRRCYASKLAGRESLSCIVRELSDDEATIIMVDSNLQRETVLPSEKAFAYKMKLEAMKRQGQRTDLTLSPPAMKLDTASLLGKQSGESRDQVFRFIRLANLIPDILDMVDASKIALRPAVELSYLPEAYQYSLYETMCCEDCTPSHAQAIKMRKFADQNKLTEEVIQSIMQEEKPNQKEQFKIPKERLAKYFPAGTPAQKMEDTIIRALELYRRRQRDLER